MNTSNIRNKHWTVLFAFAIVSLISGCDDDEPPLADNVVTFESDQLGFSMDEQNIAVHINLTRPAAEDGSINVSIQENGVVYGTEYTTEPAALNKSIVVPFSAGSTQAAITLIRNGDVLLDGDESVTFTITETANNSLVRGDKSTLTISFSEIVASQATMDPNVGGQLQPNKVFVDLSANRQYVFNRSDWDLGFYSAAGSYAVILNSSSGMMARVLNKTDLNEVTPNDTLDWGAQLSTDAVFAAITSPVTPEWTAEATSWIDDPAGDMSRTAIGEISSTPDDNKVYIINRGKHPDGTQRGWKKIRVIRNGDAYTLQHADIAATSFTTVEVTRKEDYLFSYVKFEHGAIELEPKKDKWDIAFTVFTNTTPVGPSLTVPYVFNDFVLQNRYRTETAEVLIASEDDYENFDDADLEGIIFNSSQLNIGSKWRAGGGPGSAPAVKTDRFYLVKDAGGNIYKLLFTALSQNGERGRPQIQFALVKGGA